MRAFAQVVFMGVFVGCSNPARTAHDESVQYVQCLKKDWYPGVTDPHAPRVRVVVQYVDRTTKFHPKDVCMSIDGRPLLSTVDRAAVMPRLDKREPMTWKGTVSPGKHDLAVHLRSSIEGKDGTRDRMAHEAHAFEASENLILEVTATEPDGELTLKTK